MTPPQTRRKTLQLLGTAAAASALGGAQAQGSAPSPQPAPNPSPTPLPNGSGFYRQRLGDLTATVVSDGTSPLASVLPTWGANPERQAEFAAALKEYGYPLTDTVNHFGPVVIDFGGQRTLIDTGRGSAGGGQLLTNLRRAGILPLSIQNVFITHGHPDHIGGLTTSGRPTFPRARHFMGAAEFEFWAQAAKPSAAVQANLIALRSRFTLIEPEAEFVPGLRALSTPGHTPHHLSVLARGAGGPGLLVCGDAAGHFLLSLKFPGAYVGFDADGAQAARTRQALFARAVAEELWVTGYHFPFPALGHLRSLGGPAGAVAYEFERGMWQWE